MGLSLRTVLLRYQHCLDSFQGLLGPAGTCPMSSSTHNTAVPIFATPELGLIYHIKLSPLLLIVCKVGAFHYLFILPHKKQYQVWYPI